MEQFDVVVIGTGAGGLGAALTAAKLGAKVAIIERLARTGGDCTWCGCVPSKALIRCARAVSEARTSGRFGVRGVVPEQVATDWEAVKAHVQACQNQIYHADDSPDVLRRKGVVCYVNRIAKFVDTHEIQLSVTDLDSEGGQGYVPERIYGDRFILATGAGPSLPSIGGLKDVPYVSYKTIFTMNDLPRRLLVVGGGPIGAELAQAFARLGSGVTIIAAKLLPQEDQDVRDVMTRVFREDGITVVEGRATRVHQLPTGAISLRVAVKGMEDQSYRADRLLVCVGRAVRGLEDLDLDKPGVKYSLKGIMVDRKFRTTARHVFAVGDCLGGSRPTHMAAYQGGLAAASATLPWSFRGPVDADCPRCTFTHPEIATVGLTEAEARGKDTGAGVQVKTQELSHVDRAVCEGDTNGFVKIILNGRGKVLGATVVSSVASETASELGTLVKQGTNIKVLASSMHAYPSFAFALHILAAEVLMEQLQASPAIACLKCCSRRRLRGPPRSDREAGDAASA